jgi:hypothetical protein
MIGVAVELATTQAAKKIAEAEGDAKSMVTRAQGEADANRIRQNSLTPQLLDLRRIENSRALIDKWNGQLPTVESGQGSGMMLQLPKPWQATCLRCHLQQTASSRAACLCLNCHPERSEGSAFPQYDRDVTWIRPA